MKRLLESLRYRLNKLILPEIIGGYTCNDGSFNKNTRVSNMSHISNKKNVTIEDNVFIGHFNYIDGHCPIFIGKGSQITNHISILTHSSHHAIRMYGTDYIKQSANDIVSAKGKISIGEYSFVGPHSTIMPGSNIGKGSIVAAYSFVKGDFPDYSIIKGQPATVVGSTQDVDKDILSKKPELQQYYYQ